MPVNETTLAGSGENKRQSAEDIIRQYIKDVRSRMDALEIIANRLSLAELTNEERYKLWDFFMWFRMTLKM